MSCTLKRAGKCDPLLLLFMTEPQRWKAFAFVSHKLSDNRDLLL